MGLDGDFMMLMGAFHAQTTQLGMTHKPRILGMRKRDPCSKFLLLFMVSNQNQNLLERREKSCHYGESVLP